ncbi:MAG: precorrin-3B C(17)-methyltransferase [Clostridia bacterium]|nr:precorrin-3B C(17)-methyltransferase [Clostridia bacterium]
MNKLYVIGIGPGGQDFMTLEAMKALRESDLIVGYGVYTDLVMPLFPDKEYLTTPMKQEIERCRMAVDAASEGRTVAMISSGDAGVYGMAGPVLELTEGRDVDVKVVAGVTAALSGGAVLGAPLTHDFAVISLSDLLTPWETIEKRLKAAGEGDFCIALYNPSSHKRADYLRKACDILLESRSPETICGTVRNIGREGESYSILTLRQLRDTAVDMFTTVFIGNSRTQEIDGRMVTPRGYRHE